MARLRSDFWVAAHLRRCAVEGVSAVQRRRGAPEAGAVFVKVDRLDGRADLYGPAPQALFEDDETGGRRFEPLMREAFPPDVEARLAKEIRFDSDLWIVEIDDREGRHFLDLAG
ncbi:hypothetical protein NS228_04905 [Methylobacterium indicum]|uniref:Uncharacterized protein n=1 Tax=Methylobacterium indicum TaxID=1775910 RepID=A0A0J6QGG4_9HYPH|nr:DUF1491 family protein [Methylobacterium indicum]KMO09850.1 hypothetical protein QR78_31450 [Methylobacterium indicum]KTS39525.1 hypothetical protein NS229_00160 [Methylobacterium indicum]KTS41726.1 hypothetical protein NS228_04905 [Methylobacterium indicum]KTS53535.1 hypothetical protein NS230_05550 [Methylobacterium indicum]BCM82102.1 hypothetical protein mvi_05630 [Methylobacterium indicum]